MPPGIRKFALTAHVVASVGWLGAVAGFLALAIAGFTSDDPQLVRSAYLALEPIAQFVIVPMAIASLVTGLVTSLGTFWGLFRHYWVVVKLVLTTLATAFLLLHMQVVSFVADAAAKAELSSSDLEALRIQLVADAAGAVVVLLVTTALSIYKPRGLTRYGQRKLRL